MIYTDSLKRHCYPILAGVIVDYKEQVLITGIKTNMQCFVCYVSPKKQENLTKTWPSRIYELTWSQFKKQENNLLKQQNRVSGD